MTFVSDLQLLVLAALFVVVLDDAQPANQTALSESLLLGSTGSRWFDKHQLIVFKNGMAGVCLCHWPVALCSRERCDLPQLTAPLPSL